MQDEKGQMRQFRSELFQRIPCRLRQQIRLWILQGYGWEPIAITLDTMHLPEGLKPALAAYYRRVCAVRDERAYP